MSFLYLLLAASFGLVCGVGVGYLSRAQERGEASHRRWLAWVAVTAVALACAAGMGSMNASMRPSEALMFTSSALLAVAFIGGLAYMRSRQ